MIIEPFIHALKRTRLILQIDKLVLHYVLKPNVAIFCWVTDRIGRTRSVSGVHRENKGRIISMFLCSKKKCLITIEAKKPELIKSRINKNLLESINFFVS